MIPFHVDYTDTIEQSPSSNLATEKHHRARNRFVPMCRRLRHGSERALPPPDAQHQKHTRVFAFGL
jgi:hypothetical protein